jgi:hypothetical protein
MALARLCLRQASTARTPAAADELLRLAKVYEERAASLGEGAPLPSNAQAPSPVAQQQQQPQHHRAPVVAAATMGLRDETAHWREHAERLRTRAAQLTDDGDRLVMLQIAETYEALRRNRRCRGAGCDRALERSAIAGSGHAVVAHDPGCTVRRNALARRLLPRPRHEPGNRSAHPRPSPAGFGRHSGARPTVLVVSGIGSDAEAARALRAVTGEASKRCSMKTFGAR